MKSILLHVNDDHAQNDRLEVALDLARAHSAHLTCVQALRFDIYLSSDAMSGFYGYSMLFDAIRSNAAEARRRIEKRLQAEGMSWTFEHYDGDPAQVLVSHARLADLIVVSRGDADHGDRPGPLPIAANVAISARSPVLVVPPRQATFRSDGPVAIAWNGSIEAAHSLRLTLPQLRLASEVHLITVDDDADEFPATDGSRYLSLHGISSELHQCRSDHRKIAETLLAKAEALHATCLVMGAYGHSRLRETVLGGVTRDLLAGSPIPLILAH